MVQYSNVADTLGMLLLHFRPDSLNCELRRQHADWRKLAGAFYSFRTETTLSTHPSTSSMASKTRKCPRIGTPAYNSAWFSGTQMTRKSSPTMVCHECHRNPAAGTVQDYANCKNSQLPNIDLPPKKVTGALQDLQIYGNYSPLPGMSGEGHWLSIIVPTWPPTCALLRMRLVYYGTISPSKLNPWCTGCY